MTEYLGRSAWADSDWSRGGAQLTGSQLVGIACHWPGTSQDVIGAASRSAIRDRIRGWWNYHVNTRGWSDIGYNFAIDQAGRVWDLRGLGRVGAHAASSSNPDANHEWLGVVFIVGDSEELSPAAIQAFIDLRREVFLQRWSGRTDLTGHGRAPGVPGAQTSCPGPNVAELIVDGTLAQTGDIVSLEDEYPPVSDFEQGLIPSSWADEGYRYLIKAAATLNWLRTELFDEIWFRDGRIAAPDSYPNKDANPHWHARRFLQEMVESLLYHVQPDVARTRELMEAVADSQLGEDADGIKAHITERYEQAAAERQAQEDRFDEAEKQRRELARAQEQRDAQLSALIESVDVGDLTAEQMVEAMRQVLREGVGSAGNGG